MSNINPNNINDAYPVAGVDNDSQGFRDNFKNIKTNLGYASSELGDLQTKVILKSALNNTSLDNNMAGALFTGAEIRDFRETSFDNGVISTSATLDHSTGHYQRLTTPGTGATIGLTFTNVPGSGKMGRFRLKVTVADATDKIFLPSSVVTGVDYISEYDSTNHTLGFNTSGAGTYYFEFLTDDAGVTYSIEDLTRGAVNRNFTLASSVSNNFNLQVLNKLIIDSGLTSVAVGNISLPQNPANGQVVSISSNKAVSGLALVANVAAGTIINGNVTSLVANTPLAWTYASTTNKWYASR